MSNKSNVSNRSNYSYNRNGKNGKNNKKQNRNWIIWAIIALVVVVAIVLIVVFTSGGGVVEGKRNSNGDLVIPLSDITNSVKIYSATVNGKKLEILVARDSNGSIRTAFNTCMSCYNSSKGYYKASGNKITCQNCGQIWTVDQFGTSQDGCQPLAITSSDRTTSNNNLVISYSCLVSHTGYFK